jgi:hypothetical protein
VNQNDSGCEPPIKTVFICELTINLKMINCQEKINSKSGQIIEPLETVKKSSRCTENAGGISEREDAK